MKRRWTILSWLVFLGLWEIFARSEIVNSKLFPGPWNVAHALINWATDGTLISDIGASLTRIFVGLSSGTVLGILVGLGTGRILSLDRSLGSIVNSVRAIPPVALVPLAILWFGISENSKFFLVSWGAFFPVWLNTHLGVRNVARSIEWSARSLGAKGWRFAVGVILPAALPHILAGIRLGIGISYVCVFVAEMTGASKGVGFRIATSHLVFRTDLMLAGMVVLGGLGALTDGVFGVIIRRLFAWQK